MYCITFTRGMCYNSKMMKREITYTITTEYEGMKISHFLSTKKYPQAALTRLRHSEGTIRVNDAVVHMNQKLCAGDVLCVRIEEPVEVEAQEKSDMMQQKPSTSPKVAPVWKVVYEDEDLLVIHKPPYMPIHPTRLHQGDSLADAVLAYCSAKKEPITFRCMNRLDRDTSGLTIIAKHYLSAGIMSKQMRERKIKREYKALVTRDNQQSALPYARILQLHDEGTIDLPIGRKEEGAVMRVIDMEHGEKAITHYYVEEMRKCINPDTKEKVEVYCVRCVLETGRTHQIRVHMKAIGYPLLGDFLYHPDNHMTPHQALCATRLSFAHPITGKEMEFEIEMDPFSILLNQ